MRDSIFHASIRSFFVTFFAVVAIGFGLIPLIAMIGATVQSDDDEIEKTSYYKIEVTPDAKGAREVLPTTAPVILKVNIQSMIGTERFNQNTVQELLIESREGSLADNRVKGVLLAINSPGGTVTDSDGIYRAIQAYKKAYQVPVYAYVDGICASGGLYIAAAADKIYASDVSLIGSVGVLIPAVMNVTDLLKKIGVESITITAGKNKDMLNPFREWTKDESAPIQKIIDSYYQMFVDIIVKNRPEVSKEALIDTYGANVFPAKEAANIGLIDASGYSYEEALRQLIEATNIGDSSYQVVQLDRRFFLSQLFRADLSFLKGIIKHQMQIGTELDPRMKNQFLYLYQPDR